MMVSCGVCELWPAYQWAGMWSRFPLWHWPGVEEVSTWKSIVYHSCPVAQLIKEKTNASWDQQLTHSNDSCQTGGLAAQFARGLGFIHTGCGSEFGQDETDCFPLRVFFFWSVLIHFELILVNARNLSGELAQLLKVYPIKSIFHGICKVLQESHSSL